MWAQDSENLKEHHKKMHNDKKYQEKYKKAVSSKSQKEYEKTVQGDTEK